MPENLFEAQYDITKRSKLKKFYESNKILIYSFVIFIIFSFVGASFYLENKEKKKIKLPEAYIEAKVYLQNEDKSRAKKMLKEIIYQNDPTYSSLSLFLLLDQKLIDDQSELSILFDHLIKNNKFDGEIKNLLIYKKILFDINYLSESEILEITKPLLNEDSLWKAHGFLLIGDYFLSKKEYLKAKEFYTKVFNIKNLHKDLYDEARSQLNFITNE